MAKFDAMEISEIRCANLKKLIESRFDGVTGRLAEKIGRQPAYVYRLFTEKAEHRRNIGEELARDIEAKLGLPRGYMDAENHDEAGEAQSIAKYYEEGGDGKKAAMKALAELPEDAAADIRPILEALKAKYRSQ